jgi:hypothetical protein
MKKYIILSVNDNVDYLYFTPLVCWAWRKLGWNPILFYYRSSRKLGPSPIELIVHTELQDLEVDGLFENVLSPIEGYRSDTITQISRLYGTCCVEDPSYLMTGDIDMIPLSDYWKPDFNKITVWGHDLTGYGHYPICYIGMPGIEWAFVMDLKLQDYNKYIKRDLDNLPQAKDPDFYKYWFSDQDLITQRLNEYGKEKITFINRGQYPNGFAYGRVDRGAWTLEHEKFIDAHLMQQTHHSEEKINKLYELLAKVWPDENFDWFKEYTREFKKLAV